MFSFQWACSSAVADLNVLLLRRPAAQPPFSAAVGAGGAAACGEQWGRDEHGGGAQHR